MGDGGYKDASSTCSCVCSVGIKAGSMVYSDGVENLRRIALTPDDGFGPKGKLRRCEGVGMGGGITKRTAQHGDGVGES